MADIDYSALVAPITKKATADGTVQRVLWPKNTKFVIFTIASGSTVAKYKFELPGASADLLDITAGTDYGVPLLADNQTKQFMDGARSYLYVQADNSAEIKFEFSVVGGRS